MYCVSGWTDGRVVFWQIDNEGRAHGAKLMRYGQNGKRVKTENPGWLYNQPGIREDMDLDHHQFMPSIFGLHLLNQYPNADINLVESEKTALICANAFGDPERNLWMACGGLKFLKPETLKPIIDSGRRLWLWPDKDGIDDWRDKLKDFMSDRVRMTTLFLDKNWIEADGPKADVADIIIRHMTNPETYVNRDLKKHKPQKPVEDPHKDEPFWDADELADPRIHEWRQKLRMMKRPKFEPTGIDGVRRIGEILQEHPILNKLINEEDYE